MCFLGWLIFFWILPWDSSPCVSPTFWENSLGSLVHTVDLDLFFGGDLLLCTMVNQYFSPPFGVDLNLFNMICSWIIHHGIHHHQNHRFGSNQKKRMGLETLTLPAVHG